MKKGTKTILLTAALTLGLAAPAAAANVAVTLPDFPVTLNGTAIDNSYRQYPLLVYKNITYFPMTYYDCRFLGVETEWTQQNGLKIEKSSLTGAYHQQNAAAKNNKTATAQIAAGKIIVNGKSIHNGKEEYPLLSYRNVTYFPLTWRFAVDEFGWKYNFSSKTGLVIDAGNAKTSSVNLKDARMDNAYLIFDFAVDKNYLYYQGKQGEIYQRPLNDWGNDKQRKTMMTVDKDYNMDNVYARSKIYEQNGKMYVNYHVGGPTMGSDIQYEILDNGAVKKVRDGKFAYYNLGDFQIIDNNWNNINTSRLAYPELEYQDANGIRKLGTGKHVYQGNIYGLYVKNENLYCLSGEDWGYKYVSTVELSTGETKIISQYPAENFQLADDTVYYLSCMKPDGTADANYSQRYLYSVDLKTGKETYIDYAGQEYTVLYAAAANGVYYRDKSTGSLIFYDKYTGKRNILNDGFKVNLLTAQNGYVIAGFEEHPKSSCRLAVYQSTANGSKQVYGSADVSDKAVVNTDGLLVYRLNGSSQLVKVQL